MESNNTYNLEISEAQAKIIINALDLYTRIGLGQFQSIQEVWDYNGVDPEDFKKYDDFKDMLVKCQKLIMGTCNGGFGIHNKKVNDIFRQAYDIQQVIRHEVWKNSKYRQHSSVCASPAHQISKVKLPKIRTL